MLYIFNGWKKNYVDYANNLFLFCLYRAHEPTNQHLYCTDTILIMRQFKCNRLF